MPYEVIGACATDIPMATADGEMRVTVYRGAILPEGVPQARIDHLLSVNLIKKIGGEKPANTATEETGTGEPKPLNARSSKGDLVEHAVSQGMSREDADALNRDQLIDKFVRQPENPPAQ